MVSLTKSLMTIRHDIVLQINPISTTIRLTKEGVDEGKQATMKPNMAKGSIQYPITLIDWKIDLRLNELYPLLPRSLQLTLARKDPIQNMRNTFTKES